MAKPTGTMPEWNTGGTNRLEPSAGEIAAGFALNAAPASSKENWWRWKVGEWLKYLNGLASEAISWTAQHTFALAPVINADLLLPSTRRFGYATPRQRYLHVPVGYFVPLTSDPGVEYRVGAESEIVATFTGNNGDVRGLARIPAGATITSLEVLVGCDVNDLEVFVDGVIHTRTADGYAAAVQIRTGGFLLLPTTGAAPARAWFTQPLAAGPFVMPDDGYLQLTFSFDNSAIPTGAVRFYGWRLGYTESVVAPSV